MEKEENVNIDDIPFFTVFCFEKLGKGNGKRVKM